MPDKILILGGIREASELAARLAGEGHDVTTSLAGRTREPKPPAGKLRIGGFSGNGRTGAEGLADYLKAGGFNRLIDCTHPFAENISRNASLAARIAGITLETLTRPAWEKREGDNWIEVASLEEANAAIPANARVLLALGSQHVGVFANRDNVHFVVRMVDPPQNELPLTDHSLVLGKPPKDAAAEIILLKTRAITHVVCRNSGGTGAYAKIEAARMLGIPVIMVNRD
jgi:precorrin-6A/cobalt-precorrin-6A reductase